MTEKKVFRTTFFISNAVKYTLKGRVDIELVQEKEGMLVFTISDTGVGIDKNDLQKIFKPFSRTNNPLKAEGSGFGLYVTKGLTNSLNGDVNISSEKGKGTVVSIKLPLKHITDFIPEDSNSEINTYVNNNIYSKILIFEDDISLGNMIREFLTQKGFKVKLCSNTRDIKGFIRLVSSFDIVFTDIAGTTRDSIYHRYNKFGMDFYLIDTAGIRKKGKVSEDLEYFSVIRSIRVIENSDVCILMIDATRGIESQDMNIFTLIQKNRNGLVVFVNKWDLVEDKDNITVKVFENAIRQKLAPFTDFPIVFGSAITKQRILKVMDLAKEVYNNKKRRIPTHKLNEVMLPIIENTPPPSNKGKFVKVKYITQLHNTTVPSFVFFCNLPQWVKEPYRRFIENRMRENWNFSGTPINIFFREK
jgi:small GTP-binding protein